MTKDEAVRMAEALVEAYQDVAAAPDGDLNTDDAWKMSAAYVAEFTMRQLFFKGLIHRKIAKPVFDATGGDHGDIIGWQRKELPTSCPLCNGSVTEKTPGKESSCEECGIYYCTWCERWRGWTYGAHDNMPEACDACWMPDPIKEATT